MDSLVKKLKKNEITIASAESITGGLFASEITKIPGASKVFKGGIVAYTKSAKINLLNINETYIDQFGIVSKEIAIEMAKSIQQLTDATIGVGVTGDAGPTLQKGSLKRQAFYAFCTKDKCLCKAVEFINETRIEAQKKVVGLMREMLNESID
jgi:nicotinamide-nucleotide amidase